MAKFYFDEISEDHLVIIGEKTGISINTVSGRLALIEKDDFGTGPWVLNEYELDDLRSFHVQEPEADEFTFIGRPGVGSSIGVAARNSWEKRKAKNATGLSLNLRRTDRPSYFINIPDPQKRASAAEALRQLLVEGKLRDSYHQFDRVLAFELRRPSEEERSLSELKIKQKIILNEAFAASWKPSGKDVLYVIAGSAALSLILWFIFDAVISVNLVRTVRFFSEITPIFFFVALPMAYAGVTLLKVRSYQRKSKTSL